MARYGPMPFFLLVTAIGQLLPGVRARPRHAFKPFGGLPSFDLRGPSWPGALERGRRLATSNNAEGLPAWESHTHDGQHQAPDGSWVHYSATARPAPHWTEIFPVDLQAGVEAVACRAVGSGAHVHLTVEGTDEVVAGLAASVRAASALQGYVLIIGSGGWGCDDDQHWYVRSRHITSLGDGVVELQGRHVQFHDAFEELSLSFSLGPSLASQNGSVDGGRRLPEEPDVGKSGTLEKHTSYGFNWDFEAAATKSGMMSLISKENGGGSMANSLTNAISAECVECFARSVARLDIRYECKLLQQPRIYLAFEGSSEMHGWLEVSANVHAVDRQWQEVLAKFELETLNLAVFMFPVSITPFTKLSSEFRMEGPHIVGSLRGGFGARGFTRGRFEFNTKDWPDKPAEATGVIGLSSFLDIDFAPQLVTPTFAFDIADAGISFSLIPSVGIKFWNSFSVGIEARGYLGAQIVDRSADFDFDRVAGIAQEGQLYARPERISSLHKSSIGGWKEFTIKFEILGQEFIYKSNGDIQKMIVQTETKFDSQDMYNLDFKASDLTLVDSTPDTDENGGAMKIETLIDQNEMRGLTITADVLPNYNPQDNFKGMTQGSGKSCREVPRPSGNMLECKYLAKLLQVTGDQTTNRPKKEDLGELEVTVFWVPVGMPFAPSGGTELTFIRPSSMEAETSMALWNPGETYELMWILDATTIKRRETAGPGGWAQKITKKVSDDADPPLMLRATMAGRPIDIQPGKREVEIVQLTKAWNRNFVHVPEDAAGNLMITASWTDVAGEERSKSVTVSVRGGAPEFAVVSPAEGGDVEMFQDLDIVWRLGAGLKGKLHLAIRDPDDTNTVLYERKGIDAAVGRAKISWLHLRGDSNADNKRVLIYIELRQDTHPSDPISVVRSLQIVNPRDPERRLRQLAEVEISGEWGSGAVDDIRKAMFAGCEPTSKYTLFGGVDVSAALLKLGPCEKDGSCPDSTISGGKKRVVPPKALNCAVLAQGRDWCHGELYSCSKAKFEATYQPVVHLKLSKKMDTLPTPAQMEFLQKRISTALSLLPGDIDLADVEKLLNPANAALVFKLQNAANFKLTPDLMNAVVNSGLLSFDDTKLLAPIAAALAPKSSARRLLGATSMLPTSPLLVTLGGTTQFKESAQSPHIFASASDDVGDTGLYVTGVEFQNPVMWTFRSLWYSIIVNLTVVLFWIFTCAVTFKRCHDPLVERCRTGLVPQGPFTLERGRRCLAERCANLGPRDEPELGIELDQTPR